MKQITVIIIDDERSARQELKMSQEAFKDFVILGEASNAEEGKALIIKHKPDLIFLDVQMPEKSGFDLLEELDDVPMIVFTTAHHQFALQAFEVNAMDYLLKPIREERFIKAIEKIRSTMAMQSTSANNNNKSIFIKDGEKRFFIYIKDIYFIESLDNYSRLYFLDQKAMQRKSLRQWEKVLNPLVFFRINRTEIINLHFIESVTKNEKSRLIVHLLSGQKLEVSSRQALKFKLQKGI